MRKKNEKNFWDMEIIGNRRKNQFLVRFNFDFLISENVECLGVDVMRLQDPRFAENNSKILENWICTVNFQKTIFY